MEFVRKLIAALLAVFVLAPVSFALISGFLSGDATSAEKISLGAVALAIGVIIFKLWNMGGFMRQVAAIRAGWGEDGRYEVKAETKAKVKLMKYRRTGSFTIPMFRQRVKLWKGASFSLNTGHVSAPKDWVAEESGTLQLTPGHLIYIGSRSNKKMTWRSIVAMSADRGVLEVQQTNRGAIRWQGRGITAEYVALANLLWQATEAEIVS